jgi:hypothetical protein
MTEFAVELELLVRARYPVIAVVTHEETRALGIIGEVAERRQKRLLEWSCSTGLVPGGTSIQAKKPAQATTRDPLVALDTVMDWVEPSLFVFKDLHPFLTRSQPQLVRRLREIALHLKNGPKTLILLGPLPDLPPELEKEIAILPLPMPGLEELGGLLDQILEALSARRDVAVDLDPAGRTRLLQAALGLSLAEAENVFARIIVQDGRLDATDVNAVFAEKRQIVRRSGLLEYYTHQEHFGNVGGLDLLKDWLAKRGVAFGREARSFGLPVPRGVLLLGVQGCGKSLCAKAVAAHWQLPLLRLDMGRLFGSLVGSSEENVRRAIRVAESIAPAVLWVDEIDKAFAGTQGGASVDGGTGSRVLGTFLTWLAEKTAPVFVVATANDISHLPPELLRKGRLDDIFFVDLPSPAERAEILRVHLARRGRNPDHYDVGVLAAEAVDFSGAELEETINSALFDAFHSGTEITSEHILVAIRETVPLAKTLEEQVRRLRHWAEGRARRASTPVPVLEE